MKMTKKEIAKEIVKRATYDYKFHQECVMDECDSTLKPMFITANGKWMGATELCETIIDYINTLWSDYE